jgi:hypothetical protein
VHFYISLTILFLSFSFESKGAAPDRLNNSTNGTYNIFSNCKKITNASGSDIMVPNGSSGEWTAFLAHLPTGVSSSACGNPAWVDAEGGVSQSYIAKPTGLQVGDLMIAYLYDQSNLSGVIPPSGFTQLDSVFNICSSYYVGVWTKIADATDVATSLFHFDRTGGWSDNGIILFAITNVNQTTPIQVHTVAQGSGTTITYTGGTVTQSNSMILAIGNICGSEQPAVPSGFSTNLSWTDANTAFSSKIEPSTGSTGNFTSSLSVSRTWAGSLFIINPP